MTDVLKFDHPAASDVRLVGGKGAGLAMMTSMDIPVPPGFIVSTGVYRDTLRTSGIEPRLAALFDNLGAADRERISDKSQAALGLFSELGLPESAVARIHNSFGQLQESSGSETLAVAVRSSATAEDSADTSFAGEYDTYLDVANVEEVVDRIVKCWASMFSEQAMSYALRAGLKPHKVEMAVVVQQMVRARSAGVMFTLSPMTGDRSRIVIESSWGLGVGIVGGEITPDSFVVSKIKKDIVDRNILEKEIEFKSGELATPVPGERRSLPSISDAEVQALARFGLQLESHLGHPVDVEWAIDSSGTGEIYFLQCRPETVWSNREREPATNENAAHLLALMRGMASKVKRE